MRPCVLSAPIIADAPGNDLQLYQDLLWYHAVDKDVAQAALNVMHRHRVYLRLETDVFSLASGAVNDEGKMTMAAGLLAASDDDGATLVIDSGTLL